MVSYYCTALVVHRRKLETNLSDGKRVRFFRVQSLVHVLAHVRIGDPLQRVNGDQDSSLRRINKEKNGRRTRRLI